MEDINVSIATIKNDIAYIKSNLDRATKLFDEHVETSQAFRDKVTRLENVQGQLDAHMVADKWLFGLMFSMQIAILTKITGVW